MIEITEERHQVSGAFDGDRILERKPIGFPQEGGDMAPYSNLFYWAHAWSEKGGLIGEHPHRGFEIMSIVLTGEIEHYDSQLKGWKKLKAGDVQLIRAGNGITHAERILAGGSIFQIWFDPDLSKTLGKPASYNDYESSEFPVFEDAKSRAKVIVGGTKVSMDTEIGYIQDITIKSEKAEYPLKPDFIYSIFVYSGSCQVGKDLAPTRSFIKIEDESTLTLSSIEPGTRIFIISSPKRPAYKTYFELAGN